MVDIVLFGALTAVFVAATLFLGWYGYKHTKSNDEFLLGRNKTNPVIIGLSYGATFLSTSAVVGFGGMSARYGMGMIWLVVLNLVMGLIVAFIVFGKRTRRIGRELGAFTFSDFLGKRFGSPAIRTLSSLIILIGMPLYCAAVMLGGVNFIEVTAGIPKNWVLIGFAVIVAVYVTYGGVIAVMYNDALQAGIMFIGMVVILIVTYVTLGGIAEANTSLAGLWDARLLDDPSAGLIAMGNAGMNGWTSFPSFGSEVWLTMVTTFILGVGIGALAQPQLVVRFMSAKDDKTMNRSLIVGSIFILAIVGSAYTFGALSNVFFADRYGVSAWEHIANTDMIIPMFVNELFANVTFGDVFIVIFILAALCASISTMSALLHTMGSTAGYDLMSQVDKKRNVEFSDVRSLRSSRICTMAIMVIIVILAYIMPPNIIAKATSVFMGLTAATLLPTYVYALFAKDPDLGPAKWSIIAGAVVWVFWAFFINAGIATVIGTPLLFPDGLLKFVDPLVVSLPVSCITLIVMKCLPAIRAKSAASAQ